MTTDSMTQYYKPWGIFTRRPAVLTAAWLISSKIGNQIKKIDIEVSSKSFPILIFSFFYYYQFILLCKNLMY